MLIIKQQASTHGKHRVKSTLSLVLVCPPFLLTLLAADFLVNHGMFYDAALYSISERF